MFRFQVIFNHSLLYFHHVITTTATTILNLFAIIILFLNHLIVRLIIAIITILKFM